MKGHTRSGGILTAARTALAPVSWGTTYIVVTGWLPPGRPLLVAALRVLPAGALLAAWGYLRSRWRPRGRQWRHVGLLSLLNFGVFFPLLVAAVYRLPGGVAAAVGGIQPLLVGAITWVVTGVRMRKTDAVVGLIAVVGVALVVVRRSAGIDPLGVLFAFGANVSFAGGVVAARRLPAFPHRVAATGWQLLGAAVAIGPLAVAVEGAPPHLTPVNLAGFGYLTIVATALAFPLWFDGIRRLPTQAPPLLGLAAPLTGAMLGWLVRGEALSPTQITGLAITSAAIAYGGVIGAASGTDSAGGPAGRQTGCTLARQR